MIKEIQYLRGIAASLVVLYHVFPQLQRMGYQGPHFEFLSYGVDIFFVISGFIMTFISIDNQPGRWDFLKNRFVRIVPIYWLLTSLIAVIGVIAPFVFQSTKVDWAQYIQSLLFIPYIHPISHGYFPLLQPGWTLNYEMYFYLIFALFLGFRGDAKYFVMILALCLLTTLIAQYLDFVPLAFYGDSIILEFCFGIFLGYLYVRYPQAFSTKHAFLLGIALLVCGFILFCTSRSILPKGATRVLFAGIPSLLIVTGALFLSRSETRIESRLLERIGDSSYSLYLTNYILMSALGQAFRKFVFPHAGLATYFVFPLVSLVVCIAAGYIFHQLVEVKLTRKIRRLLA